MNNETVWVICRNDFPEFVVRGNEEEAEKQRELAEAESHKRHGEVMNYWHKREVGLFDIGNEGIQAGQEKEFLGNRNPSFPIERLRGGEWLAAARTWIQWNGPKGDSVTWGSEQLLDQFSVCEIEELAHDVALAAINEYRKNMATRCAKQ